MADETLEWDLKLDADTSGGTKMDAALKGVGERARDAHGRFVSLEKGAGEHLGKVGKHAETLEHKIRHEFGGVGHSIKYVQTELKELAEFTGLLLLFEGLEKVTEKVMELGREMLNAAGKSERMGRVFEHLSGGKEAGEGNRKWLEEYSKVTEQGEEENEALFVNLKKVGMNDQDARLALKASSDIAAVSANRQEAMDAATGAFARLERTGKVNARSLAPLGLGPKDFATLDSFHGLSMKAVEKRMEEGKVTRDELFKLIMSKTHETMIGQRSADNSDLLLTRWAKIAELPERFYKRLGDTGAVKVLEDSLGRVLEKLDPDSPSGKKISAFLDGVFTKVSNSIDGIDFDGMADTLTDDVLPLIKSMVDMVKPTIEAFERFFRGAERVHAMFSGGEKGAQARSEAGQSLKQSLGVTGGETFLHKYTPLGFIDDKLHQIENKYFGVGKAAGDGMKKGIDASGAVVADASAGLGRTATEATRSELKTHSPSVVFQDIGAMVGAGFVSGIEESAADVDAAVSRMLGAPASARGGGMGGGAPQISMPITVNVTGAGSADPDAIAQAVADKINEVVPGTVQSMFEQLAMQTGSAS